MKSKNSLINGVAWMTVANFTSRLIGLLYIILWYRWMGEYAPKANAIFLLGYNFYALFLLISTAGLPDAVAKQLSRYFALNQKEYAYFLIKSLAILMLTLGVIAGFLMYLVSPFLSLISGGGEELVPILRSLAPAVLIFPLMSLLRGTFQGLNQLKPSALSQIIEQFFRVGYMLICTYLIMQNGNGDYLLAVKHSTFAAFIGMLASFFLLLYFLLKQGILIKIITSKRPPKSFNNKIILVETLREALPFVIMGSTIQLFQIVDQLSFYNIMSVFTNYSTKDLQIQYAYFAANPQKITAIIISIASSISGVGIPLMTRAYLQKDIKNIAKLIGNSLLILSSILIPVTVGVTILSKPLYTIFYGIPSRTALSLFIATIIQTPLLAFYTLLSPLLLAVDERKNSFRYLLYGMIVKIIIQIPCIYFLEAYGPITSTSISLLIILFFISNKLNEIAPVYNRYILKKIIGIIILTLFMAICLHLIQKQPFFILLINRFGVYLHVLVIGLAGTFVYLISGIFIKVLDFIFPNL